MIYNVFFITLAMAFKCFCIFRINTNNEYHQHLVCQSALSESSSGKTDEEIQALHGRQIIEMVTGQLINGAEDG